MTAVSSKACVGLAVGSLILAACASTARCARVYRDRGHGGTFHGLGRPRGLGCPVRRRFAPGDPGRDVVDHARRDDRGPEGGRARVRWDDDLGLHQRRAGCTSRTGHGDQRPDDDRRHLPGRGLRGEQAGALAERLRPEPRLPSRPGDAQGRAKIAGGLNPEGLAVDAKDGAVWVANRRGGSVSRIERSRNEQDRCYDSCRQRGTEWSTPGRPRAWQRLGRSARMGSVCSGSIRRRTRSQRGSTFRTTPAHAADSRSASRQSGRRAALTLRTWSASIP